MVNIRQVKKICLTSFDLFDVQSVKRFVRRLITKWYDHYSSHHLIYNVKWIASPECTVFHRSIDLVRVWGRALNIHSNEGKVYPSCKMPYVPIVIFWALWSYCFIYFLVIHNPVILRLSLKHLISLLKLKYTAPILFCKWAEYNTVIVIFSVVFYSVFC